MPAKLLQALALDETAPAVISLVGGGGKTTTMFRLAAELKALNKKVLVTTTTNIFVPEPGQCDVFMLEGCRDTELLRDVRSGTVVCLGGGLKDVNGLCKVQSVDPVFIDGLCAQKFFDFILVEADGAKHKPIKAPADHEPVIPSSTTMVIGVIGLDALDKSIDEETVHRSALFCSLTGKTTGDTIDQASIVELIRADTGLFKSAPVAARKIVLLNKADTEALMLQGQQIARELSGLRASPSCCVASLQQQKFYRLPQGG